VSSSPSSSPDVMERFWTCTSSTGAPSLASEKPVVKSFAGSESVPFTMFAMSEIILSNVASAAFCSAVAVLDSAFFSLAVCSFVSSVVVLVPNFVNIVGSIVMLGLPVRLVDSDFAYSIFSDTFKSFNPFTIFAIIYFSYRLN